MIRKMLAAAAFALALSPAALAQDAAAPKFSTSTSTVGQLLDNPEAKAAFAKVLPELANHPDLEQGREMTLKAIADMGYADATKFKELDAELAKIK
jgi:para-nitrobenzyl esterase